MSNEYGYGGGRGRGMGRGMGRGCGWGGGQGRGQERGQGLGGGRGMGGCRGMTPLAGISLNQPARDLARRLGSIAREIAGSDNPRPEPSARVPRLAPEVRDGQQGDAKIVAVIDRGRCAGCGVCVGFCPEEAIRIDDIATVDPIGCTGCGSCVEACPNGAISLSDEARCAAG